MKLFARRALAFLVWSPLLSMATGCGSQEEGERCSQEHGNLDCSVGLECKQVYVAGYHRICCPVPPAQASVAACNASGRPPADGGTTTPDASPDTRTEGGADASAPDTSGNDTIDEATGDRSAVDTRADVAPDRSADTSMPDIGADRATSDAQDAPDDLPSTPDQTSVDRIDDTPPVDGPEPDAAPDAPPDVASEASPDVPAIDVMTPIDVGDAPAEGGPG
jgi:hypothetical protein